MPMGGMYRAPKPQVQKVARALVKATKTKVTKKSTANEKANYAISRIRQLESTREKKFYKYESVLQVFNNTTTVISISDIAVGNTDSTRIGDTVSCTSIDFQVDVAVASSTTVASFRLILFYWNRDDSGPSLPTIANLLLQPSTTAVVYPIQGYVRDARKQFTIIKNKTWTMDVGGNGLNRIIRIKKSLRNHQIQFTAGSASGTGKVYLALMSDASTGQPCNIVSIINFTDA